MIFSTIQAHVDSSDGLESYFDIVNLIKEDQDFFIDAASPLEGFFAGNGMDMALEDGFFGEARFEDDLSLEDDALEIEGSSCELDAFFADSSPLEGFFAGDSGMDMSLSDIGFFGTGLEDGMLGLEDEMAFTEVECRMLVVFTGQISGDRMVLPDIELSDEDLASPLGKIFSRLQDNYANGWLTTMLELDDFTSVQDLDRSYRKMSLALHPDKHLTQVELANASFVLIKECMERLKKYIPPALTEFESFKDSISDMSSVGMPSVSVLLNALGPLKDDPFCSRMLERAYLAVLSTGNSLFFFDQVKNGNLADLLVAIQTRILVNGKDLSESEQSINERLLHLSSSNNDSVTIDSFKGAQHSSKHNGIILHQ